MNIAPSIICHCPFNAAVNGVPSCVNRELLQGTLRDQLGFQGYVVTDCTGGLGASLVHAWCVCGWRLLSDGTCGVAACNTGSSLRWLPKQAEV